MIDGSQSDTVAVRLPKFQWVTARAVRCPLGCAGLESLKRKVGSAADDREDVGWSIQTSPERIIRVGRG